VVPVLLAAGGGSRFDGPTHKLLALIDGVTVIDHAIGHAVHAGLGVVLVVTGSVELHLERYGADVVQLHNEHWAEGQATSVAMAATAAARLDAHALVFGLGDQPFIPAEAWRLVATAPSEHHIALASYAGRRGPHPVRLHRSMWAQLPATGDDGARTLIREHLALVHEVPCPGSAADIDTVEDLHRWTSS
jgi:molybdenum cofactor cytidylyltransferase